MSLMALEAPEAAFGVEHPAAHQRLIIVPSRQCLTLRVVSRATEIIDSMAFVIERVRANRSDTPSRRTARLFGLTSGA